MILARYLIRSSLYIQLDLLSLLYSWWYLAALASILYIYTSHLVSFASLILIWHFVLSFVCCMAGAEEPLKVTYYIKIEGLGSPQCLLQESLQKFMLYVLFVGPMFFHCCSLVPVLDSCSTVLLEFFPRFQFWTFGHSEQKSFIITPFPVTWLSDSSVLEASLPPFPLQYSSFPFFPFLFGQRLRSERWPMVPPHVGKRSVLSCFLSIFLFSPSLGPSSWLQ